MTSRLASTIIRPAMGIVKGLALGLFGFLLFLSLIILGPGHTVNSTALSPDFIGAEIDKIRVSSIVSDVLSEQLAEDEDAFPEELETAIVRTVYEIEPVVKEQLKSAIRSVGDYLRGKKDDPELALVMGDTFLNATFVGAVLDKVDITDIAEKAVTEELPDEFADAALSVVSRHEAELKTRVAAATDPIFAYVLGKTDRVDLATVLRDTLLSTEFVIDLLTELDVASLSSDFLREIIADNLPEEVDIPDDRLDEAIAALEPAINEAMTAATDPVLDYLLGQATTLSVAVSLDTVMEDVEDILREAFLDSAPAGLSQSERDRLLDEFLSEATAAIPSTVELDETVFGSDITNQITDALADAEDGLTEARNEIAEAIREAEETLEEPRLYVGYFLSGYMVLLALIAVCVLAIIALHRQVRGATRQLGITALTCGILEFAVVLLGRNFAVAKLAEVDIPQAVQGLPELLINDVTAPLQTLSIGLIAVGVILIAVSIVYPRMRQKQPETQS